MNQIFRITVGQDTLQGRLPSVRVGKGYSCRFFIYGVAAVDGVAGPKIWIAKGAETYFWTGVWDSTIGAWIIDINPDATATVENKTYALTAYGETEQQEFFIGQAAFVVYATIITGGETGGTAGTSVGERLDEMIAWKDAMTALPMFDPESAYDIDLRRQVQTLTNALRGTP